jgi:ribosomal protein S11
MLFKFSYLYILFFKFSKKLKKLNYYKLLSLFLIKNFSIIESNKRFKKGYLSKIAFSHGFLNSYFNYFIIIFKNLIRVFYRRYRTVILRKRLARVLGSFRLQTLQWASIKDTRINSRFYLPLVFGSRASYKQFRRQDWLFLLKFGVEKEQSGFNLELYFDFLKKVIKFFPKRRLLLLNKVFICRIRATKNNLFFTFYFINGKSLVAVSAGSTGFQGKKKRTPLAAKKTAIRFSKKVKSVLSKLKVKIESSFFIIKLYGKSSSSTFKEALNGLRVEKFPCNLIVDNKSISHGGLRRLKKPRRV